MTEDEKKEIEEQTAKANEAAERLEKATAEARAAGIADAGETPIEKKETEDEKWEREAKVRYAGTGLDPTE